MNLPHASHLPMLPMVQWCAGLSFAKCHFETTVPNDPYLPQIFDGEEYSRALRGWTNGYGNGVREEKAQNEWALGMHVRRSPGPGCATVRGAARGAKPRPGSNPSCHCRGTASTVPHIREGPSYTLDSCPKFTEFLRFYFRGFMTLL